MIVKKFPKLYKTIRLEGHFALAGTKLELGLD
jgi:hypothetical protein